MAAADTHQDDGDDELRVVRADVAGFAAVQEVFGSRGPAARCQCQRYKLRPRESFSKQPPELRAARLREQISDGADGQDGTSGVVAYLGEHPVGWCAVEPRSSYPGLLRNQKVPWLGRDEDRNDPTTWAVTCFFVRPGSRRRGVGRALVSGAVAAARSGGARALEAYPMTTTAAVADELHPGLLTMFLEAGFVEVTRPTTRRAVVRMLLSDDR